MSREAKVINAYEWGVQETIRHYEAFGWELLSINGTQITMSRETQNPVYPDLVKAQAVYEKYVEQYKSLVAPHAPAMPQKVRIKTLFVSFICLVIPCVVYSTYKILQNRKYKQEYAAYVENNNAYENEKKMLRDLMEEVVLQSCTTFFAQK